MKHLKYFLFIILYFSLINGYSQTKIIKGRLAKSIFTFLIDSVLIKREGVNPNSQTPNDIGLETGFCCYDSTCKKNILFEVSKIDIKESKKVLKKMSSTGKLGKHVIKNKNFLVVDSCPPNRLYTVLGQPFCSEISFSTPILFSKNKYCLVSYMLYRFGEATMILKKQNKKWSIYKTLCESYY